MSLKRFFILSLGILPLFFYGCDDDNPTNADNAPKPEMDIMLIHPMMSEIIIISIAIKI